ncbi:hypothetical protein E5288_WYG021964 [Bos mutus]|uniref:Uncharacterized protein n=1 Tax=Bos mutus TaxID=72004 RepID=A0A6B0SC82_9CETA|nr:hypothetical protein [Bos mutus]
MTFPYEDPLPSCQEGLTALSLSTCLKTLLETLWITNCLILESDLTYRSQCPSVSVLKGLGLSGVNLTSFSLEPLQVLIEWTTTTLQDLDLDECSIMDSQFSALLSSLSHCSHLTTFSFCGNPISMAMLQSLLHHTMGMNKLNHVLYPACLESYEDVWDTLHLDLLAQLHARPKQLLCKSGRPSMVWVSANPYPHCGDQIFYDTESILYPATCPPSPVHDLQALSLALGNCHPDLSASRTNTKVSDNSLVHARKEKVI